jgi:hypothetical protein
MSDASIADTVARVAELAVTAAAELAPVIARAIAGGDTSTLADLARVCPTPAVLAAQDAALEQAQRDRAAAELGGAKGGAP